MHVDVICAGAGIWGCTVARRLAEAGRKVLVLEKRSGIGGNCRCETDAETGIEVHKYGSHIFHTGDEEVWRFVRRFAEFNNYRHKVLACYKGRVYHLPIGRTLYEEFGTDDKQAIFDAFIKGYSAKQWGMSAEKVDPSIIARLKVRDNYSTEYFDDPHQGIPLGGYNAMFERMLEHLNISVRCDAELRINNGRFCAGGDELPIVPTYYSGPLDALFGYKYGALPWRTLHFEQEKLGVSNYQGNSVVNYTDYEVPYTRIHEFKHYHPERAAVMSAPKTIIMREYSEAWASGDEPYYPIDNADSRTLLACYLQEAAKFSNLVVGGRLGSYKYYDMDKSVAAALSCISEV